MATNQRIINVALLHEKITGFLFVVCTGNLAPDYRSIVAN